MQQANLKKVANTTRKTVLVNDYEIADTVTKKLFGLIFEKKGKAMLFRTRFGIHTFFMKYPIDVLVLDKNYRVVKLKEGLKPNKLFFWNPKHGFILELPKKTIRSRKIILGTVIHFK